MFLEPVLGMNHEFIIDVVFKLLDLSRDVAKSPSIIYFEKFKQKSNFNKINNKKVKFICGHDSCNKM